MERAAFRPYEGDEPFIFISYAHKNSDQVFPILEKMDAAGYRVWYDDGIAPGSEWPEYIAEHLNRCSVVVAFVSQASIDSPNCRREITYALSKQKPFLGVILEKTQMSPGMELQLAAQQCILRYNYRTENEFLSKLIGSEVLRPCKRPEAAGTLTNSPDEKETAPEKTKAAAPQSASSPARASKKKLLTWLIPAALCVLIVGGLALSGVFGSGQEKLPVPSTTAEAPVSSESRTDSAESTTAAAPTAQPPAVTTAQEATTAAPGTETTPVSSSDDPAAATTAAPAEDPEPAGLKGELVKVMSVTGKYGQDLQLHQAGVVYLNSSYDRMGLRSFDGETVVEPIYSIGSSYGEGKDFEGLYLIVSSDGSEMTKTPESINRLGLVDSKGEVILPEEYAAIYAANEYYAVCVKVEEETSSPEEAVLSVRANTFDSAAASSDKVYFTGEWQLMSLTTGEPVPDMGGTKEEEYSNWKYGINIYGELVKLGRDKYIRGDGTELRQDATVLENGSYLIAEPSGGTLFATDGSEIFQYDSNEYTIEAGQGDPSYYACRKLSDGYGYTLLDEKGAPASVEFVTKAHSAPYTLGQLILLNPDDTASRGRLYDREGKQVSETIFYMPRSEYDGFHHVIKAETNGTESDSYLFIGDSGETLMETPVKGSYLYDFAIRKDSLFYNYSTGTFDLQGTQVAYWWVSVQNSGGKYDLVDTFTGEKVLRGYDSYHAVQSPEYGWVVAAAYGETVDIFILK